MAWYSACMTIARAALWFLLAIPACAKSDRATPASGSAAAQPETATKPGKDPATATQLVASGALVRDVRTPEEFADGHLPAAVNVPIDELPARLAEVDTLAGGDKSRPVVVYCASGARAGKARSVLESAGHTRVVNGGGLDDLE